ncbi:deoxyguanosinetriphosphate triphosphohydrolase [Rhodobacter sphaeroides]|mgnify:CR=1 FL=1|jgi:deoxyguanosinetriphosphate triphosphohydrolase, putative|uniref:Deoxyguanosinetriphosphate triphosphohydrolase-like protein n=1 Tax=Cereibacter sphaeroides (strain ATCC 17023 / DSM 158 / JCM 6121 / CCUG 31486 / LMG 2827 / NBRC 12203 / NCIMB 8253 / ATH 2.4.1.) TaxID=272943 RepID=Q3J320_CERS4|nr:deoxyguanosinetriphosphate triphosphohydrolase [Cereibacter sphaeroides]ABA78814.1 Deoxyguanosinetriphosphate triphosphohydrolase [Cereibacter sphaeroides 2.4.1]AMJ47150.1 deoxyguanosinetriphosphate triphosphohydrolase [Cereibacter sphaeroides]ANS33863.1 deoxyguanosinetriphosphate triphosphohydrolase [Cereibacter sphaeroides]ATN62906.1 deoxyguanosinetriphosphate triphosphohydrolase [Cereibacter sphaeroides]AXC61026.1 deoxyguanosinetriphosphate triphosphohydrolase [Cereibacter sphaeroides 2.
MLAPFACQPGESRGRQKPESMSTFRSPFQRDRDRIIHSSAFRRLKHKTQVFVEHEGDYYRTRLTHSIEVAQVARTISGVLGLNTDLAECIALAHDLGHTPFGHTGEDALARLMEPFGGFDHNAQAMRIVTRLERHYAEFDGLNLTWESLEGIAKHNGPVEGPLPYALAEANAQWDLELHTYASAEAQVAAIADDVAYSHHDLHDGLRSGLFTEADLMELPVTAPAFEEVDALYPGLEPMRRRHEALRRVFGRMVEDVIAVAQGRLEAAQPKSVEEIRQMGATVIRFSKPLYQELKVIRSFLFHRMYRAPSVMKERAKVTAVVNDLFPLFMARPELLPQEWRRDVEAAADETTLARIVADYVAGMTDRFALQEHARLCG